MNRLTIAVAGGRKTQGIVDACASAGANQRVLVLTFTQASQQDLSTRIADAAGLNDNVEVMGWYAFLLRHFVRPYLLLKFPGYKLTGFNYDGDPGKIAGPRRFLDATGRAYQLHLACLAWQVNDASDGSVLDRLEHIYTDIYIDEAQDVSGWALEILDVLFGSKINIHLVGDMRQALLSTDPRDPKNSPYRGDKVISWYRQRETQGTLAIEQRSETYRSNQTIASFSDTVFDSEIGYSPTTSLSDEAHPHTGLFRVRTQDVIQYRAHVDPMCLHWRRDLGANLDLPFVTFGVAKGRTVPHVLIFPTNPMKLFLKSGKHLEGRAACSLYVGITRAVHSVAFILDDGDVASNLTQWEP